jgi:hypothetical protein
MRSPFRWNAASASISFFGSVIAFVAGRLLEARYYGVRGVDAAAFVGAAALFVTIMFLASAVPAMRAARVDPVRMLSDS